MIYNLIIDIIVNGTMLVAGILILRAMIGTWEKGFRLCMHDRIALNPCALCLEKGGQGTGGMQFAPYLPQDRSGNLCGAPCEADYRIVPEGREERSRLEPVTGRRTGGPIYQM